eukprot:333398-Rhodomonas_salina.2
MPGTHFNTHVGRACCAMMCKTLSALPGTDAGYAGTRGCADKSLSLGGRNSCSTAGAARTPAGSAEGVGFLI